MSNKVTWISDELHPNLDNMRIWAEGLLDPHLRQGAGRLATRTPSAVGPESVIEYCCLGVACELAIAHGVPVRRTEFAIDEDNNEFAIEYDGQRDHLPDSVCAWLNISSSNPSLLYTDGSDRGWASAAELNDGEVGESPFTFAEISAAIKRTFNLENNHDDAAGDSAAVQTGLGSDPSGPGPDHTGDA